VFQKKREVLWKILNHGDMERREITDGKEKGRQRKSGGSEGEKEKEKEKMEMNE